MNGHRVVFMGCPAIASESLSSIHELEDVDLTVVTYPDRRSGRGGHIAGTDVKKRALELSLPVLQPENASSPEFVSKLESLSPDLVVIVAYGRILSREVLDVPRLGCINLHASLLPRFRGASPVQAALAAGEKQTGVTIQFVSERMDAGDIICSMVADIGDSETTGELMQRLSGMGAKLLQRTVKEVLDGSAPRTPQNENEATYCHILSKEDGRIDWSLPARQIHNHVRAMNPWPVAFASHAGKRLRIFSTSISGQDGEPGLVLEADPKRGITVACGKNALHLDEIQPENRKKLDSSAHVRGRLLKTGDRLGR